MSLPGATMYLFVHHTSTMLFGSSVFSTSDSSFICALKYISMSSVMFIFAINIFIKTAVAIG